MYQRAGCLGCGAPSSGDNDPSFRPYRGHKVYDAAGKVFVRVNVAGMKLEAFKYYYAPANDLGLGRKSPSNSPTHDQSRFGQLLTRTLSEVGT
jgi:hypothetical protein